MTPPRILIVLLALFCPGPGTCLAGDSDTGQATAENTVETRIYEVFGMDCPGCHGGLENLVGKLPEVKSAKSNWKKQQLSVEVVPSQSLDDEQVYDAIRRANFTPGKRIQ